MVLATGFGGYFGSRAAAERSPVGAPESGKRRAGGGRTRRITAAVFIAAGLGSSATALATDPMTVYGTAATGPGCVLVAVGLALLARELLAGANLVLRAIPVGKRSAAGHLARINLRVAPERIRPVVTFLTLFVGVAASTLSMQAIENSANGADDSGGIGQLMASINYLVVGLIAAFMAIALTNNVISSIRRRGKEFAAMSSVGATAPQLRRMLTWEMAVAVLVSVTVGCVGAMLSVIPFAILKKGGAAAAFAPVPYVAVVLVGAVGSLLIARWAARGPTAGAATAAAAIA
ncbi:FtsX-like permease family protein [Nakamurella aerolata]|uniref:ABC3 transporter permease C-terminal domain-containing protein n=1 Tax=Nakamurella aerolata TaxID=1656892 RepID=A0A849A9J6_9ACTN|nr:FtsX-like permease family protein [Nakamurella aerolata]NNG37215.1 hypothetical protein [Nakamurella aerolata]